MLKNGFKRVQKWVLDIESTTIQEQMKADLANYKITESDHELNQFALEQMNAVFTHICLSVDKNEAIL